MDTRLKDKFVARELQRCQLRYALSRFWGQAGLALMLGLWNFIFCAAIQAENMLSKVTAHLSSDVKAQTVSGTIGINAKGATVLQKDKDTAYTLSNSQTLPKFKEQFPLHLQLAEKKGHGDYYREIKKADINSVGQWRLASKKFVDLRRIPQLQELNKKTEKLNELVTRNLEQEPEQQDLVGVLRAYKETRSLVESLWPNIKDQQVLTALLELKRNLDQERLIFFHNKLASEKSAGPAQDWLAGESFIEKRFFGMNDNYRPEIYAMISRLCNSCVAIVKKDRSKPLGSGVLIGKDIVLTCKHNIDERSADSFETSDYVVWFDFEERRWPPPTPSPVKSDCWPPPTPTVKYACREIYRSKELDFVLLEIRPNTAPDNDQPAPLKLSKTRVDRWTPIVLVGYPDGNQRQVHDDAWVLYPHELRSDQERGKLESQIAKESVDWTEEGMVEDKKAKGLMAARDFLDDNYEKDQTDGIYRYTRYHQPTIGAVCDTFEGDSGAPAVLRETGKLIGILYRGLPDIPGQTASTDERKPSISGSPGTRYHELILPITAILAELQKHEPELKERDPNWGSRGIQSE